MRAELFDLGAMAHGMRDVLERSLGPSVRVEVTLAEEGYPVHADRGEMENVLLNLAIDARDAMTEGGRLRISAREMEIDEAYVAGHPDARIGRFIALSVADDGAGMSATVRAHAFEPFFTTKDVGSGSGLGLSMVEGFARRSGGFVELASEEGEGAAVTLYLPKAEAAEVPTPTSRPAEIEGGQGETVLIVEDDAAVRSMTAQMPEDLHYTTLEAESLAAASHTIADEIALDLVLCAVLLDEERERPAPAERGARTPRSPGRRLHVRLQPPGRGGKRQYARRTAPAAQTVYAGRARPGDIR